MSPFVKRDLERDRAFQESIGATYAGLRKEKPFRSGRLLASEQEHIPKASQVFLLLCAKSAS
jgi:hypothetical protein